MLVHVCHTRLVCDDVICVIYLHSWILISSIIYISILILFSKLCLSFQHLVSQCLTIGSLSHQHGTPLPFWYSLAYLGINLLRAYYCALHLLSGAANSRIWPNCALSVKSVKLGTNILWVMLINIPNGRRAWITIKHYFWGILCKKCHKTWFFSNMFIKNLGKKVESPNLAQIHIKGCWL